MNEIHGVAAVMFFAGIIVLFGIFTKQMTFTSHFVAVLFFIGFLIGRLISLRADGKPGKQISQGIIFELALVQQMFSACL